ncbi:hypothetical protein, partial [Sphingomonas sp.]|uniref:hypothetical protein n=1 Tax=Sphingomonas sp. TaxID=28214 RepID=UPI0025EF0F68
MQSKVMDWRDSRSSTPRAADLGVMVLRELLKFGKLRGLVSQNAAAGIPTLYRGGNRAEIIWTEEDIDRFCWHAIMLERPHMIDGLMLMVANAHAARLAIAESGDQPVDVVAEKHGFTRHYFAQLVRLGGL